MTVEQTFRELIADDAKWIENLMVIEDKQRNQVPFKLNPIQADVHRTETGRDIYVKPAQVGFSSDRLATRLKSALTIPGTNVVLIAYQDFITERLLSKTEFFYYHLASLGIPGFPEIYHNSTYEKTFRFMDKGRVVGKSSFYIASARSYVAGRAETIHHLLCDEHAFWTPEATERILLPAISRVPPDGTVDIFSTPNGEDNDFHDIYALAKEGKSVFTPHFYSWFQHPEYIILLSDKRMRHIPDANKKVFTLSQDEEQLVANYNLTFDQIRWRRWKILEMESLRRQGETRRLFPQEFPEDDVSCFLATGDMYYDTTVMDELAKKCYPAKNHIEGLNVWYPPEDGVQYIVSIDPGQAKLTQSAISVVAFVNDDFGNIIPKWCARDAGLYSPEVTSWKAIAASDYYNRAMITWEANSHGLAVTELLKNRRPIYLRRDIVSGREGLEPGWLTTSRTKDYMLHAVHRALPNMICHDIELIRELRNIRMVGDKVVSVGADDIHDSFAIALVCNNPHPVKRGFVGSSGWKW